MKNKCKAENNNVVLSVLLVRVPVMNSGAT